MTAPAILDRDLLVRRRERALRRGGLEAAKPVDFLLARSAEDIVERLAGVTRRFPLALVLGAYHGLLARALCDVPTVGRVVAMEAAPGLAALSPRPAVVADEEALPFAPASLDLVVSALALQWVNDLPGALVQLRHALRPDGLLLATLLGGRTLTELRTAWLAAEEDVLGGASPRVAPFADVRDLGSLAQRAGFALPVVDSETVTVTYASPLAVMGELRAMGASNPLVERSRRPVTRRLVARAAAVYAAEFGTPDGRVPATFEILTLTAWAPDASQPKPLAPGSAKARLADALGVPEGKLTQR